MMGGVKQEDQERISMILVAAVMVLGGVIFVLAIGIILGRFL